MSDGNLKQTLTFPENLYWAWEKVRRFYRSIDGWYDELAVAKFEANLESELRGIAKEFERSSYRMQPLRLLPQPKKPDSSGTLQTRQAFWVAVRDQVAWTAYMNVVGPRLDQLMPAWSYGNRLHRSVWYENAEERSKLHIGRYRSSSSQIYRKFRHSWPLYRRHVYLTIRQMSSVSLPYEEDLGAAEIAVLDSERLDIPNDQRLPYLREGFWVAKSDAPHWVSLDLKQFYPTVNLDVIRARFREEFRDDPELVGSLLDDLLRFRMDLSGFTNDELAKVGLSRGERDFPHIPTGLIASGFLANVALLSVDRAVQEITREHQVAVFRYVDDHIVLAPTFERIEAWVMLYKKRL